MSEKENKSAAESLATVLSGGAIVSVAKVVALGVGFFTQIAMARFLTQAAYGSVVLTLSVVNIVALVAKLGLDDGVKRELPHHEDNPAKARGVIRASAILSGASGLVAGILLFLSAPYISKVIFDDPSLTTLLRVGSIGVPFITTRAVAVFLAAGIRDARVRAYVGSILRPGSRLLLIGSMLIAGFDALGAIVGHIGSLVIGALAAFYLTRRTLPTFDSPPDSMYRPVLAFSLPLIAVQGMGFINTNVDIYMVGYFLESASLGVYNIALQLGNMITAVLSTAGFLLPPMLTRLQQEEHHAEMCRTYQVVTKWVVVLILPAFVVLFFAPKLVIGTLFGDSYTSGAFALQLLLVGKLFAIMMGLNGPALIALGGNRVMSYIVFCQTVVNIAVNVTLIPIIGIEGAAIGMTISAIVGDALGVTVLYRRFDVHPFTSSVISPVVAVGAVATVAYGVLWTLGLPTYLTVVAIGVAYVPIVAILAPEPEDEQLLGRVEDQVGYDLGIVRRTVRSLR